MKEEQIPQTMTELSFRISQEKQKEIIENLPNMIGKELEIDIIHWKTGKYGKFMVEIKKWIPNHKEEKQWYKDIDLYE